MLTLLSGVASLLLATAAVQGDQVALKERLTKKLAEPWVTKADWITNYDKAREASKKSGKPIFAYFTRSYAH